jgi:hypothetical protein
MSARSIRALRCARLSLRGRVDHAFDPGDQERRIRNDGVGGSAPGADRSGGPGPVTGPRRHSASGADAADSAADADAAGCPGKKVVPPAEVAELADALA